MPSLHVVTHRQALDDNRIDDKLVVVVDALFATSSIVHAFDHGVERVIPASDPEHARGITRAPVARSTLAGELRGVIPAGFQPFAPRQLATRLEQIETLVYSSSNGTPALLAARGARRLFAGALLNAPALARHIAHRHAQYSVVVVCAGTLGALNLEDFFTSGCLVEQLQGVAGSDYELSDSARAAAGLYRSDSAENCLHASRVGRLMSGIGLADEVSFAARIGISASVPEWNGRELVDVGQDDRSTGSPVGCGTK